jgi:hypothetical protein
MNGGSRIGADGLWLGNAKVADLTDVVQEFARADVTMITIAKKSPWALVGGLGGAAAGLVAGLYTARWLASKQCGGSCAGEQLGVVFVLGGVPAAGAIAGYVLTGRETVDVVYRASAP